MFPLFRPISRWSLRRGSTLSLLVLALSACAAPWQRFAPGDDISQVTASLGKPRESYQLANGVRRLLWPTQPMGETTTAADVDTSGKLLSIQQVLTNNSFAQAEIGKWQQRDILAHFGKPVEKSYFPLMKLNVWTYRYMDADVWYMMYNFYFDNNGVLQRTSKSPDPLHDPDRRFGLR